MTKKFWRSWRNRVGETEQIWMWEKATCPEKSFKYYHPLLGLDDRILSIKFENDNIATIVIERHNRKLKGLRIITVVENETRTVKRKYIHSIEFKRNKA